MQPNTFSVRFVIRKDRENKEGYAPIHVIITVSGAILNLSINRKALVKDWLIGKERLNNYTQENKHINEDIEAFKSRIYHARTALLSSNQAITLESLKNEILGVKEGSKTPTLLEVTIQHNAYFEKLIGVKYSYGSYKNYKTTLKYLQEFIPQHKGTKDIALKEVNYNFCEAYFLFLTTVKPCKQNGANKHLQRLKKIMNYCVKKGYVNQNPVNSFSLEFSPVNKTALTLAEIAKLEQLDLKRDILQKVRDVFLIQCYTGLSYSDIKELKMSDIVQGENSNEYWIKKVRKKTLVSFSVPLLPQAQYIINKYLNQPVKGHYVLPVISNQKMNENLKLIQELTGIHKNLTTHLARHTFATTITLGHGVPIETVSKMLGHTKLATTQVYAKVLDNKIGEDMKLLKDKLSNKSTLHTK